VAAGVDVKMAQAVPGQADSRVTLELYAQVVTEQHKAAVDATAARFLDPARGVDAGWTRPRMVGARVPIRGERACEQALSVESGGGDLNSGLCVPKTGRAAPNERSRTTFSDRLARRPLAHTHGQPRPRDGRAIEPLLAYELGLDATSGRD
jgi:hypothetical protein